MNIKYILKLFIYFFIIFSALLFIYPVIIYFIKQVFSKHIIEGLTDSISDAFCQNYLGSSGSLDDACSKLSKNKCGSTSCCVWTSEEKCVAGSESGPTFNTDKKGKTIELDYYYYQGKKYSK
jgi:hypothetical protein